jgi:DNA-binding MarR family transcriptional regulator
MGEALKKRIKQERFESAAQEAFLNLLIVADHLREKLDRVCAKHGITHGQYNVLRILRGVYPDGHPRCEIAARLLERAPDVTRMVDRLEGQGLVARDRSTEDRRLSITRITKRGLKLIDKINPEIESMNEVFKKFSRQELKVVSEICEKIYDEEQE